MGYVWRCGNPINTWRIVPRYTPLSVAIHRALGG